MRRRDDAGQNLNVRILVGLFLLIFADAVLADELTRGVQEQLQTQGAYSGPLDGNHSTEFVNALKAYQQRHNLPASGVIDRATAKALDDESGLALPSATAAPAKPFASSPSASPAPVSPAPTMPTPDATAIRTATPQLPSPSPVATSPPIAQARPTVPVTPPPQTPASSAIPSPSPINSPPLPSESPPQFATERMTAFLRAYLHAGEGKYVTPQLRYFSFPVDYFAHGQVKEQFVRSDTLRYMRRWPRRRYLLIEPVKVTAVDSETATVDFTIAFTVQRGKRRANGRTSNRVTLREINGELKIVAIKEQRVADNP